MQNELVTDETKMLDIKKSLMYAGFENKFSDVEISKQIMESKIKDAKGVERATLVDKSTDGKLFEIQLNYSEKSNKLFINKVLGKDLGNGREVSSPIGKDTRISRKEMTNLLEGRSVYKENIIFYDREASADKPKANLWLQFGAAKGKNGEVTDSTDKMRYYGDNYKFNIPDKILGHSFTDNQKDNLKKGDVLLINNLVSAKTGKEFAGQFFANAYEHKIELVLPQNEKKAEQKIDENADKKKVDLKVDDAPEFDDATISKIAMAVNTSDKDFEVKNKNTKLGGDDNIISELGIGKNNGSKINSAVKAQVVEDYKDKTGEDLNPVMKKKSKQII